MTTTHQAIQAIVNTDQPLDLAKFFPENKKPSTLMIVMIPQEEKANPLKESTKKQKKSHYEIAMEDYKNNVNVYSLDSYMAKRRLIK